MKLAAMEPGTIARVIKDFLTTNEGELCINKDEYVQVIQRLTASHVVEFYLENPFKFQVIEVVDRHWARCRTHGPREGTLPSSHISPEEIGTFEQGVRIFVATNDFVPEQEGDLGLVRGCLVIGVETVDEHWVRGQVLPLRGHHAAAGTFPPSYCWEMDPSNYIKAAKREKQKVEKFGKVLHSMRAQLPEEIDMEEGDIVKIVEIVDKDWYRGVCKGRSGIFPASFVRIIDAFPDSTALHSRDATKPYTEAEKHKKNEYMNTRNTFGQLEDCLKSMGQQSILNGVMNGLKTEAENPLSAKNPFLVRQHTLPAEILTDDYFKKNLPASYGSVSVTPPPEDTYDAEKSIFGGDVARCSRGFQVR